MKLHQFFAAAAVILSLLSGNSFAQGDKAAKQAEVLKATQASLEKFYKEDPALKAAVGKAPGYAVFSTAGISFLVGGAGGKGVAHDNKTNKNTFMSMAQASAGVQIGLSGSETLIIFNTAQGLADFIAKGWVGGIGGSIQAGAKGDSAGAAAGQTNSALTYTLTKNGVKVGIAAEGSKFWKDDDLN